MFSHIFAGFPINGSVLGLTLNPAIEILFSGFPLKRVGTPDGLKINFPEVIPAKAGIQKLNSFRVYRNKFYCRIKG